MKVAIRVENLGKCYRVAHQQQREKYRTLRESIVDAIKAPFRRLRNPGESSTTEDFWALKDVSFEVRSGEVVGIIGRNGAGKSTLLKILSRITKPSKGCVRLNGRVGSLLEVGTGFHPELTGRENVYLNGSILGMSRKEIALKFDEIVAFAEVEKFLDTPVKRYSSGMYVRLAFAVAAYLQPEILIVDEVLAVGDSGFQKKCLEAMKNVSRSGRTVLMVSHNMAAIMALCDRCVLMQNGSIAADTEPDQAIRMHIHQRDVSQELEVLIPSQVNGKKTRMTRTFLTSKEEVATRTIQTGDSLIVHVEFYSEIPLRPVLGVVVKDLHGTALFGINNRIIPGFNFEPRTNGMIACHLDRLVLQPGRYMIDLYLGDLHQDVDILTEAISFDVTEADLFGSGKLPPSAAGPIIWPATWSLK